ETHERRQMGRGDKDTVLAPPVDRKERDAVGTDLHSSLPGQEHRRVRALRTAEVGRSGERQTTRAQANGQPLTVSCVDELRETAPRMPRLDQDGHSRLALDAVPNGHEAGDLASGMLQQRSPSRV